MRPKKRTIAVVTGTRAEFGLLVPVLRAIEARRELTLKLIVTGTHWTAGTWRDIRDQGFRIDASVKMQRKSETGRAADVEALARGVRGMGRTFAEMKPDVVLVLGDRIEVLAAATAASIGGFRVAHIHGGDRAEGVADEAMRHAVSKLAHLHFPATALSRKRLVKMGEHARNVFNVGSPAVDGLDRVMIVKDPPEIIVLQHPIGESDAQECRWACETMAAIGGYERLVLGANRDPGHDGVMEGLLHDNYYIVEHLPRGAFLAALRGAKAIVGNSSAGLIEAAVLKVPCVNVGPRQAGREKPANVIDCDYGVENVRRALRKALKLDLRRMKHPYGDGHAGERIANILATTDLSAVPLRKRNAY